jgi:hypothetical protein
VPHADISRSASARSRYGDPDRRPSRRVGTSQWRRLLRGSISAMPSCTGPSPRPMTFRISRARAGNRRSITSRFRRSAASTSAVARTRSQPTVVNGRRPSSRAAPGASRTYQLSCRSAAPRSSSQVLISTTIRIRRTGSKASRSIHPRMRPRTIVTSRRVIQPRPLSRRSTYPEHRAWTRSRCRGPPSTVGATPRSSNSSPRDRRSARPRPLTGWPCRIRSTRYMAAKHRQPMRAQPG